MVEYHPFDSTHWDEPFEIHKQLRDEAPAFYLEEFNCWFISRFEDVWNLEQDQRNFDSQFGTTTTHLLTRQTPTAPNITGFDGREHTRVRSYFNPFFKPAYLKELEERTRGFIRDAVDAVIEKGEADAVNELGGPVSVRVACSLLGIPLDDVDQILDWVNGYFHREPETRGTTKTGEINSRELGLYLYRLAARARKEGAAPNTVLEKLISTECNGSMPDDKDIAIHLNMLLIGGTETFPKVFSAAICRLGENPEQRARCASDPDLIQHAFQETLRYDMPTHMLGRTVKTGFELHGQQLEPGAGIMFLWGSANRDERIFEDPHRFDIDRRAPRILSFGHGQHMCLGAHVARFEGKLLIEEVLRRMPDYQVEHDGIERIQSEFFRGFARMPISFKPGKVS